MLEQAGWILQDMEELNLSVGRGIAVREFPLLSGPADYLLYGDKQALGVVEAKKVGQTLTGFEMQSERYGNGLPKNLPAWGCPLPFLYESSSVETHFTNGLDPEPRARDVFSFHRPETLSRPAPPTARTPAR